ncbi:MAG TPA: ferritin-like domain-containing protein, partial [Polyangiaceae bacterium]|nr:ferritin-like domain-containing protein [Polyangiaceae bacterium]
MTARGEPEIITHEREQLAYLLTEAAEIEHGLMCCYLYAAGSLKAGSAGLGDDEARAIARWRATIVEVAVDEMLHLSLVSNLLAAIGSTPHFQRPNFPVAPGYHPAGVVVALAPFDRATLDHFIFLERPEGVDLPDGAGFESPTRYERVARSDRLVPSAQDYATVGHLYRGIREGFVQLAAKLGEDALFLGDPAAQVGPDIAPLDGLLAVTGVAGAVRAVDTIVHQGEGAPEHRDTSHFSRFVSIRDELDALSRRRADFSPAHPAARNPVMRKPPKPRGKVHVDDPSSARVLDLGNAVYAFALRCLARAFGEASDPPRARGRLVESSITAMRELGPLMQRLAEMPASPSAPGTTAGLTFTMQRSTVGFSQQHAAWAILAERAREIALAGQSIARDVDPIAARAAEAFTAIAATLAKEAPPSPGSCKAISPPLAPPTPAAATAAPSTPDPIPASPAIEEATAPNAILRFEGKRCIHSRNCVLGAPDVFLANVKGPWLHPEAVPVDELAAIAHSCPS